VQYSSNFNLDFGTTLGEGCVCLLDGFNKYDLLNDSLKNISTRNRERERTSQKWKDWKIHFLSSKSITNKQYEYHENVRKRKELE